MQGGHWAQREQEVLDPVALGVYPLGLCAQMTDISCLWKMNPCPFMIALLVLQYHTRTHSPCLLSKERPACKVPLPFKVSLMPSFFLCAFYENVSLFFLLALATSASGLQTPKFLYCVLLASSVQPSHYYKCSGSYCSSQIYSLSPSNFWPTSSASANWPAFLYWFAGKDLGTGAQFIWQVLFRLVFTWKYDVASQYTKQGCKSNTNSYD